MIPTLNASIVSKHADDAAFLWLLRERAVVGSRYSHEELRALDSRVDAHLDGLRLAGEYGWSLCLEQLREWTEPGEAFAAAWLMPAGPLRTRLDDVLQLVGRDEELEDAVVAAASWHPADVARRFLLPHLEHHDSSVQRLGVLGLSAHRVDPGEALALALAAEDERLASAAVTAAGQLGRIDLRGALLEHAQGGNDTLHRAAALALARMGCDDPGVVATLESSTEPALVAALIRLRPQAGLEHFRMWAAHHERRRVAIEAATVLGDPATIPQLLEWMHDEQLARPAGEALSAITGVDLEYEDLDRDPPPGCRDDDRIEIHPDDELPWPSAFAVAHWWRPRGERFTAGERYLQGLPIGSTHTRDADADTNANLLTLALRGRPRWRAQAAMELARRFPSRPSLETRAPTARGYALPGLAAFPSGSSAQAPLRHRRRTA